MSEPKNKGHRYNWEYWFGHSEITLRKGIDYHCLDHGFGKYIHRAAKRHGYKITTVIGEGQVKITVLGQMEPDPSVHANKYRKGLK